MISCTVYRCLAKPGSPCCTYCGDKTCLNRCFNHPDRCRVWVEKPEEGLRNPKAKIDAAEAVRLYQEGLSTAEIAEQMGYSREHIGLTLRRNGIRQRKQRSAVDHEQIWRLHRAGLSGREIAAQLGCSASTVSQVLHTKRGDGHV